MISRKNQKIVYEYDFGDGWGHTILLQGTLPYDADRVYPVCLDGARACPPDDCGGIWGYAELLETIKDPEHEEYESTIEWLPDSFDPEEFDKEKTTELLQSEDFGCMVLF